MIRWCLKRADEKGEIKVRGVRDRRGDRLGLVYLNRSIHSSTIILGLLGMISIAEEWRKLVRLVGDAEFESALRKVYAVLLCAV
jgi:hypothetical protein